MVEKRGSSLRDVLGRIREEVPELAEAERRLGSRLVVARNVTRLRMQRGWTQARLAEELGVRQPRVAEIESAGANLQLDTLDALAAVFSIPAASLLTPARREAKRSAQAPAATS